MPETAGDYSTQVDKLDALAGPHERPQGLLGQGEGVLFGGADGYPARPGCDGAARRPPYDGRGSGALGGPRYREIPGPVGHGACSRLPREQLDPREAEQV